MLEHTSQPMEHDPFFQAVQEGREPEALAELLEEWGFDVPVREEE